MDPLMILGVVTKGIQVISALVEGGSDIKAVLTATKNLTSKKPEEVTDADLEATEKVLDEQLAEFNKPLPPEGATTA